MVPRRRSSKFERSGLKEIFFDHFAAATPDTSTRLVRVMVGSDRRVLASKDRVDLLDGMGDSTPNIYRNEWIAKPTEERQRSGFYKWPETHIDLSYELPFTAAPLCLGVARVMDQVGYRATVRQVRWAYRLHLSAPELPLDIDIPTYAQRSRSPSGCTQDFIVWDLVSLSDVLATYENAALVNPDCLIYNDDLLQEERVTIHEVITDFLRWQPWKSDQEMERYLNESTVAPRGPQLIKWQEGMVQVLGSPGRYVNRPPQAILWAKQLCWQEEPEASAYELAQVGHSVEGLVPISVTPASVKAQDVIDQPDLTNTPQMDPNQDTEFYSRAIRDEDEIEQKSSRPRDTQAELQKLMDEGALG